MSEEIKWQKRSSGDLEFLEKECNGYCPICESDALEWVDQENDGDCISYYAYCLDCGQIFQEVCSVTYAYTYAEKDDKREVQKNERRIER
jgi:hypothetical protein